MASGIVGPHITDPHHAAFDMIALKMGTRRVP
jgi:hypothetical protein